MIASWIHVPSFSCVQDVGDVVVGSCLAPSSKRHIECRQAMFEAGFPYTVPVATVNR